MGTEDHDLDTWAAIREGDIPRLEAVLDRAPEVVRSWLGSIGRTPLHVVTDWPGFFPNGPRIAQILVDRGAEVDAREPGGSGETPLHWAASSDDAEVARVLIKAGADIEEPNGSIGTPLDNAVGYACWNVARLLAHSGARVDCLWHAAALGLQGRLEELTAAAAPSQEAIDQAFWHACAAGQRRPAEFLLAQGANLHFKPSYGRGTVVDAASNPGTQRSNVIEWLTGLGVRRAEHEP